MRVQAAAEGMIAFTACLVLAGCLSLALSQERNWKAVMGASPLDHTQRAIRFVACVLLVVALSVSIAVEGPGFAMLIWTLQIAVASFIVAMALSFRPGIFKPVARAYSVLQP